MTLKKSHLVWPYHVEGLRVSKHGTEHSNCDVGHCYANCRSQRTVIVACKNNHMYKWIPCPLNTARDTSIRHTPLNVPLENLPKLPPFIR